MVAKNFKFMENYNSWTMYLQFKIFTLDVFIHMLLLPTPPVPSVALPCSINISQACMTWNVRLFIFYIICNFFKRDDFTVL